MKSLTIALPLLALAARGLAKPCGDRCVQDACYKGALSGYPWCDRVNEQDKEQCSSFLASTVTASAVTITSTVVVATTPTSFSSETATDTQLTTDVETSSVVTTEIDVATSTTTLTETVTETATSTSTTTAGNTPPGQFPDKRTAGVTQTATATAGQLPGTIGAHCNADQYSSVCHCFGVKIPTVTASAETVTETETATVTGATVVIETTVTTVTTTITAATVTTTIPFSTFTTTNTITTETSQTTETTTTTTETTATVAPPMQTVAVRVSPISSNQDPSTDGTYGILNSLNSEAYFIDFQSSPTGAATFGINTNTGEIVVLSGTGNGLSWFYSRNTGPTSYVLVATPDFASNQGGILVKCRVVGGGNSGALQCVWKDNQIAEFWLCGGHLNLVQPGYDFTNTCAAGGTSTRVNVGVSPASI